MAVTGASDTASTMVDIDALLAQESWALRLARALVLDCDEAEAEEVVQDARLAWWQHPPRDLGRARAWLGTVLRNLARNRRRAQLGRRRHEQAAPEAEAVPSPELLMERLDLHRELAEAVARLDEPFRQVVLLRYYEGLTAAAIARRLQVPAGTIRWRLKTGLERLRQALDARHGDRRAWVLALAPLARRAGPPNGEGAGAGGGGGWALRRAFVPVASALTLVISALGLVGWRVTVAGSAGRPPDVRAAGSAGATAPLLVSAGAIAALSTRSSPAGADATLPAWTQLELGAACAVAGRVLSGGEPVAGARLRLTSGMLSSARHFDRQVVSSSGGTFAFSPQPPTNWFLTVTASGLEPAILYLDLRHHPGGSRPGNQPMDALVIDLRPCQAFARGVVKDAAGTPIAGAQVRVAAPWNNGGTEVRAGADGRYQICLPTRLQPLSLALIGGADGYGTVETAAPAASQTLDFVLEPQVPISGRVLRDADGEPLAGSAVSLRPIAPADPDHPPPTGTQPVRLTTVADEQGRFELTGAAPGRYHLSAAHDEVALHDGQSLTVEPGEPVRGLEVRLRPLAIVEGDVVRDGQPAAHAILTFQRRLAGDAWADAGWTASNAEGRFRVRLARDIAIERILAPDPALPGTRTVALAPRSLVVDRPRLDGVVIELGAAPASPELARAVTPPGATAPRPQVARGARLGELVQVLGYDLSSERVLRGGALEVTMHFRVLGEVAGWRLFSHLEGPRGFTNLDHAPVGGAYPVERWRPGETIRDHFTLPIGEGFPPGRYTWLLGFWNGGAGPGRRLPVTAPSDGSPAPADNRWPAFSFTVE
jgi:RNA polymerase sigma-70 factor (ECF subfamily)